jgi:hypothetical protein
MPTVNHSVNFATSLQAALLAAVGLSALISARLYAGRAAQGSALPRVIWHEISSLPDHCHDSATSDDPGIEDTLVQFDCEGRTLSACRTVADAISEALNGATITGDQALLQGCFRESGSLSQAMDHLSGDGVTEAHRLSVTYRFLWRDN